KKILRKEAGAPCHNPPPLFKCLHFLTRAPRMHTRHQTQKPHPPFFALPFPSQRRGFAQDMPLPLPESFLPPSKSNDTPALRQRIAATSPISLYNHERSRVLGALFGTLSYKVFYVQGEIEPGWQERYLEKVRKYAFEALTPDGDEEASDGWVPIDRPLNVEFDLHTFLYDRYINLGFRQDKYAIPAGL